MRIAVNTRFLNGQLEGYGHFTKEVFVGLATQHPEHQFFFLFDRPVPAGLELPVNVTPMVISPKARHLFSFKWWFDVKVPLALKRINADVFISPDGFCSLATSVPQVVVIHDLAFLHFPRFISRLHLFFYKRYTPRFIKKAKVIATVSGFSQHEIIEHYKVPAAKVLNVSSAARSIFAPLEWEEKEQVKEEYAEGCEYFVFVGGVHPRKNLLNLLKAFSLFKKRQHTNMKLLVVGRLAWDYQGTLEKLEQYKFRKAVKMLGYLPDAEVTKVIAAAYALVFPSYFEGFGVPVLEAMQSDVPVIASNAGSLPEVGEDAVLYCSPDDPSAIADQMKLLYKDERLRGELVAKGRNVVAKYTWQKTQELMWSAIQKAVST